MLLHLNKKRCEKRRLGKKVGAREESWSNLRCFDSQKVIITYNLGYWRE
jgi:hypothetical protein